MVKPSKRARRRLAYDRLKKRAYRLFGGFLAREKRKHEGEDFGGRLLPLSEIEAYAGQYANTPKPCSCSACGNRRAHEGPTRQELLAELRTAEMLGELTKPLGEDG